MGFCLIMTEHILLKAWGYSLSIWKNDLFFLLREPASRLWWLNFVPSVIQYRIKTCCLVIPDNFLISLLTISSPFFKTDPQSPCMQTTLACKQPPVEWIQKVDVFLLTQEWIRTSSDTVTQKGDRQCYRANHVSHVHYIMSSQSNKILILIWEKM